MTMSANLNGSGMTVTVTEPSSGTMLVVQFNRGQYEKNIVVNIDGQVFYGKLRLVKTDNQSADLGLMASANLESPAQVVPSATPAPVKWESAAEKKMMAAKQNHLAKMDKLPSETLEEKAVGGEPFFTDEQLKSVQKELKDRKRPEEKGTPELPTMEEGPLLGSDLRSMLAEDAKDTEDQQAVEQSPFIKELEKIEKPEAPVKAPQAKSSKGK